MTPSPPQKRVQLYLDARLHRKLRIRAAKDGTTVSEIVRNALALYMKGD